MKKIAKTFAITRGPDGALLYDGTQYIAIEGFPVKAIDTNGAGDCFAGTFLAEICQGTSFEAAGKAA